MYNAYLNDIEKTLKVNGIIIEYDENKKVKGVTSEDPDNDLTYSVSNGVITNLSLANSRIHIEYRISASECLVHIMSLNEDTTGEPSV